jgi:membrane protein
MHLTLKRYRTLVWELFRRFNEDQGGSGAATISFFALLAFVPLLVCAIAALGYLLHDADSAAQQVEQYIARLIPGENANETARQLIEDAEIHQRAGEIIANRGWAWIVGLLTLIWTASRIFANAIFPLNAAFNAKETRNFFQRQAYALAMLLGAGTLFFVSLAASALPALVSNVRLFQHIPDVLILVIGLIALPLSITLNALMFALIYRYLVSPEAKVHWRDAIVGGSFVAVLWEIAKQGFAFYLSRFGGGDSYNRVYGSLGGLIILLLWVYYTSFLLLLGAEVAQMFGEWSGQRKREISPQ